MSIEYFSSVNIQMMCSTYFKIKVSGLRKDMCFFLTSYFEQLYDGNKLKLYFFSALFHAGEYHKLINVYNCSQI